MTLEYMLDSKAACYDEQTRETIAAAAAVIDSKQHYQEERNRNSHQGKKHNLEQDVAHKGPSSILAFGRQLRTIHKGTGTKKVQREKKNVFLWSEKSGSSKPLSQNICKFLF
jgi:hypothetical protein